MYLLNAYNITIVCVCWQSVHAKAARGRRHYLHLRQTSVVNSMHSGTAC